MFVSMENVYYFKVSDLARFAFEKSVKSVTILLRCQVWCSCAVGSFPSSLCLAPSTYLFARTSVDRVITDRLLTTVNITIAPNRPPGENVHAVWDVMVGWIHPCIYRRMHQRGGRSRSLRASYFPGYRARNGEGSRRHPPFREDIQHREAVQVERQQDQPRIRGDDGKCYFCKGWKS